MRPSVPRLQWSVLLLAFLAACDTDTTAGPDPDPAGDPQLAIGGTPGKTTDQIQIILDVQPNSPQDFVFKVRGAKTATLLMDDDTDPILPNIRILPSLKPGIYYVTLGDLPYGYSLTQRSCANFANGGSGIDNNNIVAVFLGNTIVISLEKLERVVCTFVVSGPPDELTVTINQAAFQNDPTPFGDGVFFDVTFSGGVLDFDASDIALTGSAEAWVVSVTPIGGTGTQYQVAVAVPDWFQGEVTASIPAGVAADAFGNQNEASTSTDNTVTVGGDFTECVDENGLSCEF
jgi:hypothetical protein